MKSFIDAPSAFDGMPADVGVLLGRIDVSKGREQLYEDQMPELLQTLSEQSRVESIRASNAIEGIEVEEDRAEKLARSDQLRPRNRSEKEFAGYRDAIDGMMAPTDLSYQQFRTCFICTECFSSTPRHEVDISRPRTT